MSVAQAPGAAITTPNSADSANITVRDRTIINLSPSLRVDLLLRGLPGIVTPFLMPSSQASGAGPFNS
jgi:hypothetical protein